MPAHIANNRLAIIDADGLLFAAALQGETSCDGVQMEMRPATKSLANFYQRVDEVLEAVGADECYLAFSDRRNFRYDILPTYKGQRKNSKRPLQLDELRAMVSEESPHRVFLIKTLEADDVCGIMAGILQKQGRVTVIVSPDKDLLQIPGLLYAQGKVTEVTQETADRWHMTQTLAGDTCDNYKGLPGWGVRKAGDLLDLIHRLPLALQWQYVIAAFEEHGLTEADCLVQARVSRILRPEDWDAKEKIVKLWNFPG